jgi:hypothetical protein
LLPAKIRRNFVLSKSRKGRKSRKGIENGKLKMENYSSPKVGEVPHSGGGVCKKKSGKGRIFTNYSLLITN